ncbi:odorant receptor 4-like [Hyposmocoma kahamanoa]|uniref:odorant receptor 4-like n=1 Tax=Hyposmocoma kahamanoa TaxID=1477025 RepID=UPI000E6D658A|nr:odorant receptor 4-like [Hyposmocoma kahamanoa]
MSELPKDGNLLFDKYLRKIDYAFRWSGLHLRNRDDYNMKKARFLYWFNSFWLNKEIVGGICFIAKGAANGGLVSMTHTAPSITLALLSNIRSLSIMWHHGYVDKLVFKLRELETKTDLNNNDNKTYVERPIEFLHFVLKLSGFFNWLLILAFPLMPLSISVYNYLVLKKVELVLPFLISYPFDAYDIKIYPFVLLHNIYSESFYYICTTFIVVQFKLLQQEIKVIIPKKSGNRGGKQNVDKVFQMKIMELVKWHQALMDAVAILETIYSKSTLFNFVSSSAMICLAGFNITMIDNVAFIIMFLALLCLSLVQIFLFCFFGDTIIRSNLEVSDAVYNCNWYLTSAKKAKMLHYLQMRGHRPCKLTAYGFADVNMIAFSKIMNSAWSYFALLKTVNK